MSDTFTVEDHLGTHTFAKNEGPWTYRTPSGQTFEAAPGLTAGPDGREVEVIARGHRLVSFVPGARFERERASAIEAEARKGRRHPLADEGHPLNQASAAVIAAKAAAAEAEIEAEAQRQAERIRARAAEIAAQTSTGKTGA